MGRDFGKRSATLQDHVQMRSSPVGLQILSMQFGTAFWPIPTVTAMGGAVASNLGDPTAAAWYVTSFVLAVCIAFMTCGANSDLFGRRNFILMGNILALVSQTPPSIAFLTILPFTQVGNIVAGSAKTANSVIIGMAITGFGSGNCQLAAFALVGIL